MSGEIASIRRLSRGQLERLSNPNCQLASQRLSRYCGKHSECEKSMNSATQFELSGKEKDRPLKKIGKRGLTSLVGGGIINPLGPTLTVLALDGILEPGEALPILRLMLNPFNQEAKEIGVARIGESWSPISDLPPLFSSSFGACPTFLLPSSLMEQSDVIDLYTRFLTTFEDGQSRMARG